MKCVQRYCRSAAKTQIASGKKPNRISSIFERQSNSRYSDSSGRHCFQLIISLFEIAPKAICCAFRNIKHFKPAQFFGFDQFPVFCPASSLSFLLYFVNDGEKVGLESVKQGVGEVVVFAADGAEGQEALFSLPAAFFKKRKRQQSDFLLAIK